MRMRLAAAGAYVLLSAWTSTGIAQPRRIGPEFQVNTFTSGSQYASSVAVDAAGSFLIQWAHRFNDRAINGRVFDCRGQSSGDGGVNTSSQDPAASRVAAGSSGFVVTWTERLSGGDGSGYGVVGRLFDSQGQPDGAKFQVNTYTTGHQYSSVVAADGNLNFVIMWSSNEQDGDGSGIFGQRFSSAGTPLGSEFQVNTYTTGSQSRARVAMADDGSFVAVWRDTGQDGSGTGVFAQRFNSAGMPLGGEFQVNTYTTSHQSVPAVAMTPGGGFVVAWMDGSSSPGAGQDGGGRGIFGQRFDSAGTPLGSEFQVNTYTTGDQENPEIAADVSGNFVVVWESGVSGIFGQRFDSLGALVGAEFQVNSYTGNGRGPEIAMVRGGEDFVVAWTSFGLDGDTDGAFAQRFAGPCGNGMIDGAEECDDGNLVGRDGCRTNCTIQPCWICAGTPSVCTFDAGCADDGDACANVPLPGCRTSTKDGKGSLRIKDRSPDTKDQLLWRWTKGEETLIEAFGDPLSTTDYAFCLYDRSDLNEPRLEAAIDGDGTCAGKPCWKSRGDKGFNYVDKDLDPDGVLRLGLRAGEEGKARLVVKGKGANLPLPTLPLSEPVVAQLQASNGECWEAEYGGKLFVRNDPDAVVARAGIISCVPGQRSPSAAFLDATRGALD